MNNATIINMQQSRLVQEGILHYTGKVYKGTNVITGEPVDIPEIEPIHTYQGWKDLGYQVKKGEKAVAKFPIWKYITKNKKAQELKGSEDGEDAEHVGGHCYMKTAAFFTRTQVEEITEDE